MTLFEQNERAARPLADRMRPRSLDEFIGQEPLVGQGRLLRRAIEADRMTSAIFYGPPGCGKTTLAAIIAGMTRSAFAKLNAVSSGVADLRAVLKEAGDRRALYGQATYLLLDECHRWSKAQSDCVLPAIESGLVRFIGSTTENPMIAMTPAIVSRCRLFRFEPLTESDVLRALRMALSDAERGYGALRVQADEDALEHLARVAGGDVRAALNALELAVETTRPEQGVVHVSQAVAEESIQKPVMRCDESLTYDMISAFCKSLRGGDANAALLWFARLNYAGLDPRIIVRRLVAHASEDVGLANPVAMLTAAAAAQALDTIGMPEARLPIAQAIITICESPKSNSVAIAVDAAIQEAQKGNYGPVPAHLRDTSYKGAERVGSGIGYKYPHNYPGHVVQQQYMPDEAVGHVYYQKSGMGREK